MLEAVLLMPRYSLRSNNNIIITIPDIHFYFCEFQNSGNEVPGQKIIQ